MPTNHAPVTQSATVSSAADTPYVFQLADFAFDDSADAPSPDTFANVIIRTLPSPGVLMFDADGAGGNAAVEVAIGQVISAADIAAGHLSFEPGAFASGNNYASFNFQVQDSGAGPALYTTGPLPRGVIAIDVNHDSKLDLVYISDDTSAGQIGVRFGAGDGTFGEESRIAVGDTPSTLVATDLDGDNNPDLVVANYASNTVQVLKGNADGTFQTPTTIAVLNSEAIVAGDFNQDGFTDLAITERNNNLVDILLGDGTGTGTGFTTLSYDNGANGSVTTSVAMADLNEDGNMDLVFAQENDQFNTPNTGSITFVFGNPDGSFQGAQNIATGLGHAYVVRIADLNSDGHADVVYTTVETPGSIIVQLGVGDGTFLAPTTISQPAPSEGLAIADIDGDSKLDLVVTDYAPDGSVSVLRGNGDGSFQSAIHIPAASYPFSITTGDLNGDGKPDIIATNYIDNNLSVLLNGDTLLDGDDNTSASATITVDIAGANHEPTADAGGPYTVQSGDSLTLAGSGSDADNDTLTYSWDLNGDTVFGDATGATPTLTSSQLQALGITSGSYTASLRVSDGNGGDTTASTTLYFNNAPFANPDSINTTEDTPITIDGANLFGNDVDSDSGTNFSITGVSDAQGGSVVLNGGNPIFTPDANFNGPASFIYQVSDGHGGTATETATVNVASVNDAPVTQSVTVSTDEDTPYVFQLADFDFADPSDQPNPDSFANLLIRTVPGSGALMFDADGAGSNAAVEVKIGQVISATDITAGHLSFVPGANDNGDGYASFDFQVQDDGAGPALYQTGSFPRSVLAIDVNHDSKLDLVYVSESSADGKIGVRFGAGDGTFGSESAIAVGNGPSALIALNLDDNRNPDLVVTNYLTGNVQVLKGNADGTFQSPVIIDAAVQSVAVVAGNFNHDGFVDLAIADREHSEVRILLGDGTGTGFTTAIYDNGSNGSVTTSVAMADFNEDGNMDLVFASENDQFNNLNTGNVTLVLGNADGSFQTPQNVDINLGHTYAVTTADFDGDGHADLAYTLIDTPGAVVIRLGVGDGTFESPETIALDAPAIDVAVADIDGDGKLDLVATDYQPAGSLSVLRGNGDGTFQSAAHVPVASSPFSVGIGDLNGDNKPDIIATNYVANNLSVLLNGDTLLNGNANTSDTATVTIDVAAVNDAPVNTIAAQTAIEDTDSPITGLSVSDADIGFGHITVTLTVQHGTLHVADDVLGGIESDDITNNDTSSVTLSCDPALVNATLASGITYRPDADFYGTDTLTMLSDDGANDGTAADGAKTDSDTVNIEVAGVNEVPSFTVGANQTVIEDAGSQTVNGFATGISTGPANEAGQVVNFLVSNDNNALFAVQPTISASGNLSYTPASNANGTATVTVAIHDNGGTANGGVDTSATQTFTIAVSAANDAPALGGDRAIAVTKDGTVTITTADLTATDPDNTNAQLVYTVTAASHGAVLLNGSALSNGQTFTQANLAAGLVSFQQDGSPISTGSFSVSLTDGIAAPQTATVNATVDIAPPGSVTIDNVTLSEGNSGTKLATFTVTRSGGTAAFDVDFGTAPGSATNGDGDFIENLGTLHFGSGVNTQTVSVTINGDTRIESDETFLVLLGGSTNGATIADDTGVGTIINDDVAGSVAIGDVTTNEGNSGTKVMTFTVTRSGGASAFDVNFATSDNSAKVTGGDYLAKSGTLHFGDGVNTQTVAVTINGDGKFEANEQLLVSLSGATNGAAVTDDTGIGTIGNDDSPSHDFSGDGKSDILLRSDAGTVVTWDMNDAQVTSTNLISSSPANWKVAGTGDFNGDGKSDILWRSDAGTVVSWDMNDAQVTSTNVIGSSPANWNVVGTGDFNGDGKSDILWRSDAGTVVSWDMNDAQVTSTNVISSSPANWKVVGTGDFNGDGKSDILWRSDAGTVVSWDMNDGQVTSTNVISSSPANWKVAGVGDFSGDGKSDILWRSDAGTVVSWDMNDGQVTSTNVISTSPANWQIAATGDYNGDGKSDILWRSDSGTVVSWDMNDAQVTSTNVISTIPTDWHII